MGELACGVHLHDSCPHANHRDVDVGRAAQPVESTLLPQGELFSLDWTEGGADGWDRLRATDEDRDDDQPAKRSLANDFSMGTGPHAYRTQRRRSAAILGLFLCWHPSTELR